MTSSISTSAPTPPTCSARCWPRALIRTGERERSPKRRYTWRPVARRNASGPVTLLIGAGADLEARGLDDGTPLHQAAWFGQPDNANLLIDAGAPLDLLDATHESSPIGWAVHGSRYSGGAAARQDVYIAWVRLLLAAGSGLHYPGEPETDRYVQRLLKDASPRVCEVLHNGRPR